MLVTVSPVVEGFSLVGDAGVRTPRTMAEPPPLHRADTAAALGSLVAWFHLRRWQRTASATPEDAAAAYEAAADALIAANSRASESSAHAALLARCPSTLPVLLALIVRPQAAVRLQAAWALANLALDPLAKQLLAERPGVVAPRSARSRDR